MSQLPVELGGPANIGGSGRDMASLVLFLLSNWYVNGEIILIDGGVSLVHMFYFCNLPSDLLRRVSSCTLRPINTV